MNSADCPDDETLARAICAGNGNDHEQFACIHDRYQGRMIRLAGNRLQTSSRAAIETLVSETWLKLAYALRNCQFESGSLLPYIGTFIRNAAIDAHRKQATLKRGGAFTRRSLEGNDDDHVAPSPVEALMKQEELEQAQAALEALREPFRETFVLHLQGLSNPEIADQLGIESSTVGTRLFRAKDLLRQTVLGNAVSEETIS